jgi:prepilin-type processing-associated H-X9-DG protein
MKLTTILTALGCLTLTLVAPVAGQGALAAPPREPGKLQAAAADLDKLMDEMGVGDREKAVLRLLMQATDMDPAQALLVAMRAGQGGGGMENLIGMALFSQMLRSDSAKQPTALMADKNLLVVVENGVVYLISIVDGQVKAIPYRASKPSGPLPAELAPALKEAKEEALLAACVANVKQLCLATLMYAQDHDEKLPTEGWRKQLEPYSQNTAIYGCPGAADQGIGYAINETLVGVKLDAIAAPSETALFFESDHAADIPFGGADALVEKPRHAGLVVVGFADGHVQTMPVEKARKLLAQEVRP